MSQRVSSRQFVGRAEELALLEAALDEAADGRATTVLVGGDAGIGKTRLVAEFCSLARNRGALVATGACVATTGGGLPYGPIVGILRDVVRQVGGTPTKGLALLASGLESIVSGLGDTVEMRATPRIADELAKTKLFESILTGVTMLAEQSQVVLVFEDLQWADSASTELLDFLTRNLDHARAVIIATYRSEELGRDHPLRLWLGEIGRHARVAQVHLEGLGRDETASLILGILGEAPDWALLEAVWGRSQGNPFFVEELTAARHRTSLSPELQGVVLTRVETLSAEAQQLLRVVAAVGMTVDHDLLVALDALAGCSLDRALAETVDRQILVVDPTDVGYSFRHALLREAVYAAILPGERCRLHRDIATALTAGPSVGPTEPGHRAAALAAHWSAAGEWAEALPSSMSAAQAAVAVLAFPEALAHLEQALSAFDRAPSPARAGIDRVELLGKAADVAYLAGAARRAFDLARAAIDGIDAGGEPARAARFYTLLGRNCWAIGDSDAAFDAYRQAAALLPADPPSVELAGVLAEEARGLMLMSRLREAEVRCREAITVARAVGARTEEGHALNTLGCSRGNLGYYDEGIDLIREALVIAEELASPDDLNRAYTNVSALLVQAGRLEEGVALVYDGIAVGEARWSVRLNGPTVNSGEALVRLGRFDEAEALLGQLGNHGVGSCAWGPGPQLAPIAIRRGRFDEAKRLLAVVDETTAKTADVQGRGVFHTLCAELAVEEGRPEDAYAEVEQALALAAGTDDELFGLDMCALGVRALADQLSVARTSAKRVDADKARLLSLGLVQEAERLVAAPVARGAQCAPHSAALAAMCCAEQSRMRTSDPDLWREAVRQWEAASEPYPAAYCRWREAEALLEQRAGRSRASDCLQLAWEASAKMGALPLKERIERLAQRARITLTEVNDDESTAAATLASDLGLTPREVEVLGELAAGRTDREIAESLFISKKTASVHVSNLLRKLDVANRVEAGKIGQAHGLG